MGQTYPCPRRASSGAIPGFLGPLPAKYHEDCARHGAAPGPLQEPPSLSDELLIPSSILQLLSSILAIYTTTTVSTTDTMCISSQYLQSTAEQAKA